LGLGCMGQKGTVSIFEFWTVYSRPASQERMGRCPLFYRIEGGSE
jgi:hypothetical protein